MTFEQEYKLEQFREIQNQYFDEEGKCYQGIYISTAIMEQMLDLINELSESTLKTSSKLTYKNENR